VSIACDIRLSGSSAAGPRPAASPSTAGQCVIIEFPVPAAAPRSAPAPQPPRADGHPHRHPVRLTRRGRRLAASAIGALVVGSLGVGGHALATRTDAAPGMTPASSTAVVVRAGDTLWSIAHTVAPDRDPRGVVAALRARNHLSSAALRPGQRLAVPRDVP
jgi:nucleoid-associated protein YgaU